MTTENQTQTPVHTVTTAQLKDSAVIFSNSRVAKLAAKTNIPVREVRNDARQLRSSLLIAEQAERDVAILQGRYGRKGLEMLIQCMKVAKMSEEEALVQKGE